MCVKERRKLLQPLLLIHPPHLVADTEAQIREGILSALFLVASPERTALCLPPIDIQKVSADWLLGGIWMESSSTLNFLNTFSDLSHMSCVSYGSTRHTEPIYIWKDLLQGIGLYYCGSWLSKSEICRAGNQREITGRVELAGPGRSCCPQVEFLLCLCLFGKSQPGFYELPADWVRPTQTIQYNLPYLSSTH